MCNRYQVTEFNGRDATRYELPDGTTENGVVAHVSMFKKFSNGMLRWIRVRRDGKLVMQHIEDAS